MQCPFCGQDKDKVVDSRSSEGSRAVRRRRQCLACKRRFTTYERVEEAPRLTVIKKDGSRVPFDRQKILDGLKKASYKRAISDEQLTHLVEATEEEIYRRFDKEVPSTSIGDIVSAHLREVDKVAYIRFSSVYREFRDVGEFVDEVRELHESPGDAPGQRDLFDENAPGEEPGKE